MKKQEDIGRLAPTKEETILENSKESTPDHLEEEKQYTNN